MTRMRVRPVVPTLRRLGIPVRSGRAPVLVLAVCAALLGMPASGAGVATTMARPTVEREPVVLTECTVQPRRRNDLIALAEAPPGIARDLASEIPVVMPAPPPNGVPADPEIAASVTATAREMVACYNAGDLRRLFALYSEEYLYQVWGGFAGERPSRAELRQAIAFISRPVPQPESDQVAFVSVEDVRQLPDGDVSAVVNLSRGSSLSVFAYTDGWYQLVWSYPLPETVAP